MRYFLNNWMDIRRLEWIYHFDRFKTCNSFGDLDPIFKGIVLHVGFILDQWMDFRQTYIDIPLG